MENINRNTRTLIVSFVIAIMALIPLRFVEVGQSLSNQINVQVLGESTANKIVLPNDRIETVNVEAPKEEVVSEPETGCVEGQEIDQQWDNLRKTVFDGVEDEETLQGMVAQLVDMQKKVCR